MTDKTITRTVEQALDIACQERDSVYSERNRVVAVLARLFPAGLTKTAIAGWDPEWHGCVYIDLPTGQASWHFHDRDAHLFAGLPVYTKPWDGHTTEEKYARLEEFCRGASAVQAL